jgi:hypothetical protein
MEKTIWEKLLIKPGTPYHAIQAPAFWKETMHDAPVSIADRSAAVVHWFLTSKAEFSEGIATALSHLEPGGRLWISYRKETKTERFDISRDSLAALAAEMGLRPFRQVALNADWSALGFIRI